MPGVDLDELERLGLYEPTAADAADRRELLEFLTAQGVSIDEMLAAHAENRLPFVLGDRVISPGPGELTIEEAAQRAGQPVELIRRVWRALGFAEPEPDRTQFSEADVRALQLLSVAVSTFGEAGTIQLARTIGSSMARIAETGFTLTLTNVEGAFISRAESQLAAARAAANSGAMVPMATMIFDIAFRHHLEAVARRWDASLPDDPTTIVLAVGFADLVGFTSLAHELSVEDLAHAVTLFESIALDATSASNGRLVKLIGDEIMFVAPSADDGCEIALTLLERVEQQSALPAVRTSLAIGKVVPFEGDYYGPVVNLASRLTDNARGGELLVTADVADTMDHDRFEAAPGNMFSLRGFAAPVHACAVRRSAP